MLDKYSLAIMILLDFAKAFDMVPHEELIFKLHAYGITGKLLEWIKAFLSNRSQRVIMGEACSEWLPVPSGVPQGSVLGPLLFLIYINDLPESVSNLVKLFADDTKLLSKISGPQDIARVQTDLDQLTLWAEKWRMRFNEDKCKTLWICKLYRPTDLFPPFTMTSASGKVHYLENSSSERDLGVQVKHNLKWDEQIRIATTKANNALSILKRTFKCMDSRMLKQLFDIYVRPHLEYSSCAWFPLTEQDEHRLEKVQMKATKLVSGLKTLTYTDQLTKLNMSTIAQRRTRGDLIQLHKILSGKNIIAWNRPLNKAERRASLGPCQNTRQVVRLIQEKSNLTQRTSSFRNRIVSSWNSLPAAVQSASSTNAFKNALDKHFKQHNT
jgi:hypothetical protein